MFSVEKSATKPAGMTISGVLLATLNQVNSADVEENNEPDSNIT